MQLCILCVCTLAFLSFANYGLHLACHLSLAIVLRIFPCSSSAFYHRCGSVCVQLSHTKNLTNAVTLTLSALCVMTELSATDSNVDENYFNRTNDELHVRPHTVSDVILNLTVRAVVELVQRVLAAPIDRVATLTAVEGELKREGRLPRSGFGGVTGCFSHVWRKEGPSGMLRGVFSSAVLALPAMLIDNTAIHLSYAGLHTCFPSVYDETVTPLRAMVATQAVLYVASWMAAPYNAVRRTILTNYMSDIVTAIPVCATASAEDKGFGTALSRADSTTVDTQRTGDAPRAAAACPPKNAAGAVQVDMYRFDSACHAASVLYRSGGWRAFYRSVAVEPLTLFMFRGLYFMAVFALPDRTMQAYPQLIRRGLAVITAVVTQPLEVIDRRLMLSSSSNDPEKRYKGIMDCARCVVREEGVTALWSGLKFRLALTGVSIGATMLYQYFSG